MTTRSSYLDRRSGDVESQLGAHSPARSRDGSANNPDSTDAGDFSLVENSSLSATQTFRDENQPTTGNAAELTKRRRSSEPDLSIMGERSHFEMTVNDPPVNRGGRIRSTTTYQEPLRDFPYPEAGDWKTDIAKPTAFLYAMLIVISNVALSVSSQARHDNHIPLSYSKWFDALLYGLSILFLLYAMIFLFRNEPFTAQRKLLNRKLSWPFGLLSRKNSSNNRTDDPEFLYNTEHQCTEAPSHPHSPVLGRTKSSVYLKINAIICGVGAMIFSCLEFGVWVSNRKCYETIVGVISLMVIVYVSVQTYFIFLYSKELSNTAFLVQVWMPFIALFVLIRVISRHTILSRFGLMHLVATDVTIWLRVLIDQTLYEFTVYRSQEQNLTISADHVPSLAREDTTYGLLNPAHPTVKGAAKDLHVVENISYVNAEACLYSKSLFGDVLVNASVFLYPCIIGYAVISAGIIYIMCRNMADNLTSSQNAHPHYGHSGQHRKSSNVPTHILLGAPMHSQGNEAAGSHGHMCRCNRTSVLPAGTKPNRTEPNVHQLYWLDCDQAVGGLLNGSIVLGMTVVCLILFFIFKNRNPELAMLEVQIGEAVLYCLGIGATSVAFIQTARKLPKNPGCSVSWELDSAMLLVSVVGVYAFSVLSIIGSNDDTPGTPRNVVLMIVTQALAIVQATLQTIYIFEASHRSIPQPILDVNGMQLGGGKVRKPGRNALTFLIVINLAFWNMNIFKTLRSEASPTQREFFGVYEWTIITHVTVPLTLLYRFHSAAGLFEIWKHAYKVKQPKGKLGVPDVHRKSCFYGYPEHRSSVLPMRRWEMDPDTGLQFRPLSKSTSPPFQTTRRVEGSKGYDNLGLDRVTESKNLDDDNLFASRL